jgi:hypothetical protein
MKYILILIATTSLFSCVQNPASTGLHTVQCQAYKVTMPGNDTTKIEDLDTYTATDKTPQFYENWWGIRTTQTGYTFYDCWYK